MNKHSLLLILALLLAVCLPLCASAESPLNKTVRTREGVEITPLSIRVSDGKATDNSPGSGKVYVIVKFRVTNKTGGDYFFLCDLNLAAEQDGKALDRVTPFAAVLEIVSTSDGSTLPAKNMAPGETVEGEIGWIVDAGWQRLKITYSYEAYGAASAVFTFDRSEVLGGGTGGTKLYEADFRRFERDGWFANNCGWILSDDGVLVITGRTEDWQGPKRVFPLKPGVEYTVRTTVYYWSGPDSATFVLTTEQDGGNWENLAWADVPKGTWVTLEATFTLGRYNEYQLYVETMGAPNLDFAVRDFVIYGPAGGM